MKNTKYKLLVLLAVLSVSFSPILTRLSTSPALIIAAYRLAFTVFFMTPFMIFKKTNKKEPLNKRLFFLCILSGIFLALHFTTWIESIKFTSISSSTVLVTTHPIFILLLNYFIFRDTPRKYVVVSIFISIFGSIIIAYGDSSSGSNVLYGDILAILGAIFMAGYLIIGKVVRSTISSSTYTFIVYISATTTLIILSLLNSIKLYPYSIREILIFIGLSVLSTLLGHSIFSYTLKFLTPSYISISTLGEPVLATLWALLLFKESPTIYNIIGGLFVILGITLFIILENKNNISST